MRVSYFLEDCDFSINTIDIRLVLDFVFFQNFNGNFIAGYNVSTLLHFSKSSFSFSFTYNESTNLFSFAILFFFRIFSIFTIRPRRHRGLSITSSIICSTQWTLWRCWIITCFYRLVSIILTYQVSISRFHGSCGLLGLLIVVDSFWIVCGLLCWSIIVIDFAHLFY